MLIFVYHFDKDQKVRKHSGLASTRQKRPLVLLVGMSTVLSVARGCTDSQICDCSFRKVLGEAFRFQGVRK